MKRFCAVLVMAFLAWSVAPVLPAGANSIADIALGCDAVSFTWADFPERPVDLHVTLEQHGNTVDSTVSTNGAPAGEESVPATLDDGLASATVRWTLQNKHVAGPITADLHCSESTTTTAAETTTTTGPDSTTTQPGSPPTTVTSGADCPANGLACTGSSFTLPLVFLALVLIGAGIAPIIAARLRKMNPRA